MSKQQKRNKQKNNKAPKNAVVHPIISADKRLELNIQMKSLAILVSKQTHNAKQEWQQYVEIQDKLQKIMELEKELSPRLELVEKASSTGTTVEALRFQNIIAFNKWLAVNEVKSDGLCIAEFPGLGLGIRAERDIKEDEILFSIPRKVMLNEEWLEQQQDRDVSMNMTLSNVKLAYTVLLEKFKGKESFWKPYIDVLPVEYNTVLYFSVEDMEELRGSNALSTALRHAKIIARQYAAMYHCLQNAPRFDMISNIGQCVKEYFCYDMYRWAVSTATTRQNMVPKKGLKEPMDPRQFISTLIPFWDMANHKKGKITTFYEPEEDAIKSAAQSDFKKGEQIFMHYGNRPNSDLMIHNGFIDTANSNDYVNIKMGLSTSDPLLKQRSHILSFLEIPISGCELAVLPAPNFISNNLLAFVRIFNMNEAQLEHWNNSDRAKDLLHVDCGLETELESKTWKYLQTRLMLLLRVFPTTLEEDIEKLAQYSKGAIELSYTKAMILEYRICEKRILSDALEYVTQRSKA